VCDALDGRRCCFARDSGIAEHTSYSAYMCNQSFDSVSVNVLTTATVSNTLRSGSHFNRMTCGRSMFYRL